MKKFNNALAVNSHGLIHSKKDLKILKGEKYEDWKKEGHDKLKTYNQYNHVL